MFLMIYVFWLLAEHLCQLAMLTFGETVLPIPITIKTTNTCPKCPQPHQAQALVHCSAHYHCCNVEDQEQRLVSDAEIKCSLTTSQGGRVIAHAQRLFEYLFKDYLSRENLLKEPLLLKSLTCWRERSLALLDWASQAQSDTTSSVRVKTHRLSIVI